MFPLNIQPSTGSRGARSNCASVPTTSEAAQTPSYAANIFFQLEYSGLRTLCIPNSKTPGATPGLPTCSLPEAPGRAILPSCGVEHIFYILSCPDWPKGYCMNYLLFNLFKGLLLFRALFKIVVLPGHLIERVYDQTAVWNVHSPKTHSA